MPDGSRHFGDYLLLEQIGAGGMGQVFRARLRDSERVVALKLGSASAVMSEVRLERFRREGQITAALRHPQIVSVHDAGVVEGRPFLAYQLVEGARTLEQTLSVWSLRRRIEALRDVARALGYAHQQGVVHRDVKPANVLVTPEGRVLLADFGLAVAAGLERITQTQALLGTPLYMAPELLGGSAAACPQSDVYSLGVMLYEVLVGEHPYAERGLPALVDPALRSCVAPLRRDSTLPPALSQICMRALELDPTQRHEDGEAFAVALDAWLSGQAVGGPRSLRRLAVLAGVAGMLAMGWLWRSGERPPTSQAGGSTSSSPPLEPPASDTARADAVSELRRWLSQEPQSALAELPRRLRALPQGDPAGASSTRESALADEVIASLGEAWSLETLPAVVALAESGCRPSSWAVGHACMRRLSAGILSGGIDDSLAAQLRVGEAVLALVRLDVELELGFLRMSKKYWRVPRGHDPWSRYLQLRVELALSTRARRPFVELRRLVLEEPAVLGPVSRATGLYTCYSSTEVRARAADDLVQALELDPGSPWLHGPLASALAREGRLDEAAELAAQTTPLFLARFPEGPMPLSANDERVVVEFAFYVLLEARRFEDARLALAFTAERHPNGDQLRVHRQRLAQAEADAESGR